MSDILYVTDGVVVFTPDRAGEALAQARALEAPLVAYMPVVTRLVGWFVADGAYEQVALVADAYASDERALADAIAWVKGEDRGARATGALRLTSLGSLGEHRPSSGPPVGSAVPVVDRIVVGRQESATICLRQGAHSDQNTVARIHAVIQPAEGGALVSDTQSTNGTFVGGRRVRVARAVPGEEIAIACTHRFRLDGVPGA